VTVPSVGSYQALDVPLQPANLIKSGLGSRIAAADSENLSSSRIVRSRS
jgi:hypothetical protein